ncbi:MAG: glycosyltransferase family 39 protein [Planctomycetes bacterium]|nr:glycosyltransferase family 39 protein [Planctomycetota bacterium]
MTLRLRGWIGAHPATSVFLLAAAVRAAFVLGHLGEVPQDDAATYDDAGLGLSRGEGLRFGKHHAFLMPGYPGFLSLSFRLFGHGYEPVQVAQILLGSIVPVLLYHIGRKSFDRRSGALAGVVGALFYPFIQFVPFLLTENLFIPVFLASLLLFLVALRRGGALAWGGAGVATGLALLVRGQGAGLALACGVASLVQRVPWGKRLAHSTVFGAAVLATLAPWILRNFLVLGDFVPLTTQGSIEFGVSNCGEIHDGLFRAEDYAPVMDRYAKLDEIEQARRFRADGWSYIREHPGTFLRWAGLRMAVFWDVIPIDYFWPYKTLTLVRRILMYLVFALTAAGCVAWWRARPLEVRALLLVILFYSLPFVFYASNTYRHRTSIDGIHLVLASAGIVALWDWIRMRRRAGREGEV